MRTGGPKVVLLINLNWSRGFNHLVSGTASVSGMFTCLMVRAQAIMLDDPCSVNTLLSAQLSPCVTNITAL